MALLLQDQLSSLPLAAVAAKPVTIAGQIEQVEWLNATVWEMITGGGAPITEGDIFTVRVMWDNMSNIATIGRVTITVIPPTLPPFDLISLGDVPAAKNTIGLYSGFQSFLIEEPGTYTGDITLYIDDGL